MRKRELSNILYSSLTCFNLSEFSPKKAPEEDLPGAFFAFAPLEDPNVFQHTSPERLVRMMVMMVVFKLNACHKILDECLFI
jgi:hypothetical protein